MALLVGMHPQHHFSFRDSTAGERVATIAGALLVATLLMTSTTAIVAAGALRTPSELRLARNPCRDAIARTDRVVVAWTTTTDADENHVMAGSDRTYGRVTAATAGRTHEATLTGLPSGATVHFRVQSRDSSTGRTTQSGDCTVTLPGDDRTPPTADALHITAGARDARIALAANEPTLASLTVLLADGGETPELAVIGPVTPQTDIHYELRHLTPDTAYRVRVDLADTAGNSSALTPDLTFRTLQEE